MFWGDALQGEDRSDPVSELRDFLEAGGLSSDEVDGLLDALSKRPVPTDVTGPFFISAIQDLLEHLAFDTELDLASAQGKVVACWLHLRSSGSRPESAASAPATQASASPQAALKAFDEDRAAGVDAETAISRLTARLGLEEDGEAEGSEMESALPAGLVDGLIEEYHWELASLGDGVKPSHRAALELLRHHHRHTELVEELTPRSLLLFACTHLMEQAGRDGRSLASDATAIEEFASWCIENHGHAEVPDVTAAFKALKGSAARVSTLNAHLDPSKVNGEWLQVALEPDSPEGVSSTGERYQLNGEDELLELLQSGDYVRARLSDAEAVVQWCYPPELSAAQ